VKNKSVWILLVTAIVAAAAAGTGWYLTAARSHDLRAGELRSIAALLKDDEELLGALQTDAALDGNAGILGSYLVKIRADGVAKHPDMKQRLDRLADNNAAILGLLNVYSPRAKTAAFNAEADKFRRYAIAWRDRWNSVMELFMAGGNYPVAEVPFPKELLSVVQAEVEAASHSF
jgi:hypothetical protein